MSGMTCKTCNCKLHINSIRCGIFECRSCNRRTREAKRLGNLIGEIAARVINERVGAPR